MPRFPLHPWSKGLWVTGSKQTSPDGALRKFQGVDRVPRPTVRSRHGSKNLITYGPGTPHSLVTFNGKIVAGVGLGVLLDSTPGTYFGNGNRLTFVKAPATEGNTDLLYIAGGGALSLVTTGNAFFLWGIPAPPDGARASTGQQYRTDLVDATNLAHYSNPLGGMTVATVDSVTRLASNIPSTASDRTPSIDIDVAGDLTVFPGNSAPSLDGDYLEFTMEIETPESLQLNIAVDCSDGTFSPTNAIYSRQIEFSTISDSIFSVVPSAGPTPSSADTSLHLLLDDQIYQSVIFGFGGNLKMALNFIQLTRGNLQQRINSLAIQFHVTLEQIKNQIGVVAGANQVLFPASTWVRVRVPKNSFGLVDPNNSGKTWSTAAKMRLSFTITGSFAAMRLGGNIALVGGFPLKGTYQYREVFHNTLTGARSNPNPAHDGLSSSHKLASGINSSVTSLTLDDSSDFPSAGLVTIDNEGMWYTSNAANVLGGLIRGTIGTAIAHSQYAAVTFVPEIQATVDRQSIILDQLQTAPSSNFEIELYRTIGNNNGSFFLLDAIAWNSASYEDTIADPQSNERVDKFLSTIPLDIDNDPPAATYNDAVGPHVGRMWWARDSAAGGENKVYYSPEGRFEAVSSFIKVSNILDPTQKLVIWNGSLWCFTQQKIFQIIGDTEPFSFQAVVGAPGTIYPFSVVPTPHGIAYLASDGVRLFTGQESQLIGWEAIWPLFRGETVEGIPAFPGSDDVLATATDSEYLITDGITTLAYSLEAAQWRSLGIGFLALYYDRENTRLLGAYDPRSSTVSIEDPTTTTDNEGGTGEDAVAFKMETVSKGAAIDATILVRRVYVEADCAGEVLSPTLVTDSGEVSLADITGSGSQAYEWSLNRTCRWAGLRIEGAVRAIVEIARVEIEVYAGEAQQ